jgi:uncharacterized protein (TIGR02594 family)
MSDVFDLFWMKLAKAELGTKEVPGDGDNERVLEYHRIGAPKLRAQSDSVPWCAAFVGWVLAKSNIPVTGLASARSYLNWGYKISKFKPGCVVVMKRGNSSWQGHVTFGVSEGLLHVMCLGGNQGDAVSLVKYPKSSILGYRWCDEFDKEQVAVSLT